MRTALLVFACLPLAAQQYTITTIAGGPPAGTPSPALNTAIGDPAGLAADSSGNVYIAAMNCIFRLTPEGMLVRMAGVGLERFSGDGGPAARAGLDFDSGESGVPVGIAVDPGGSVYFADVYNRRVRKISPDGLIRTIAADAGFTGVAVDRDGVVYVSDPVANRVWRVSTGGALTSVAETADLDGPAGLATDAAGNLYIGEVRAGRIRKLSRDGSITTVAENVAYPASIAVDGAGQVYVAGGSRVSKIAADGARGFLVPEFFWANAVAVDAAGNVYVGEAYQGRRVRRISPEGAVTTVAGNGSERYGGDGGPALNAQVNPACCTLGGGMALDVDGNLYFADTWNNRVRRISRAGIITTVVGNGIPGYEGDGGDAATARVAIPMSLTVGPGGDLFIADTWNFRIRRVARDGTISTYAGTGVNGSAGEGGPALNAQLGYVFGLASDRSGNLYLAEIMRLRKISPDGIITTIPMPPFAGAVAVAADAAGNVYVADHNQRRIRKLSPDGVLTVFAGNGNDGFYPVRVPTVDGIAATDAALSIPVSVTVDPAGNVFIGEWGNSHVRMVDPSGVIRTVAGNDGLDTFPTDGPALDARLSIPANLAADADGNVYIAESLYTLRVLRPVLPAQ